MTPRRLRSALVLFFFLSATACTPELKPRPHVARPPSPAQKPVVTTAPKLVPSTAAVVAPTSVNIAGSVAPVVRLSSATNLDRLDTVLEATPSLRLTVVFPAHYFDDARLGPAVKRMAALQQAGRVEVALSLDNEPILPLLGNIHLAAETQRWRTGFAWPDDIGHQMASGSAAYQRRWAQLPSGLYPPYQAVSNDVMESSKRFRLNWVLGAPHGAPGVRFFGATALIVPPLSTADWTTESGMAAAVESLVTQPFSFVDMSGASSSAQTILIERMDAFAAKHPDKTLTTLAVFVSNLKEEYALPANADPMTHDFTAWVATPVQHRAWIALGDARAAIERYKNSGHANLQHLDAAMEEMGNAESGPFLLALGTDQVDTDDERNFVATIGAIHRLAENPVPGYLSSLFSDRSLQRASPSRTAENDRPFFVSGDHQLTWNDPAGDDNGAGKVTYPEGHYPKGLFDLRSAALDWSDEQVTFTFGFVAGVPTPPTTVVPLVDVYVDINRLPGAGSVSLLPHRGDVYVERDAAWEYALAVSPAGGALYQSVGGGASRLLKLLPVERHGAQFQVSVPRSVVRGEPASWRLSVAVGGPDVRRPGEEPAPVTILPTAADRHFGGATPGRPAMTFVDVLAASAAEQDERLGMNESGRRVTLPYLEAQ